MCGINEDEARASSPNAAGAEGRPAWADEIIDDLQASFDTEGITENDSGDALVRLSSAIEAVEDAAESRTPRTDVAGGEADKPYQVIIDRRDLFDALRGAWRDGQSYGDSCQQVSWSQATDYASRILPKLTDFAAAQPPSADVAGAEGATFDETDCRAKCDVCPGSAATGGNWPCARKRALSRASAANGAESPRGTDAQILFERKLTCEAINGAMAFGYQNTNPPPSDDHWLAPYWKIGRQQAEALDVLHAIESDLLLGPHPSTALAAKRARKMIDAISPSAEG